MMTAMNVEPTRNEFLLGCQQNYLKGEGGIEISHSKHAIMNLSVAMRIGKTGSCKVFRVF